MERADDIRRAEFPPAGFWRRWAADAPAAKLPADDDSESARTRAEIASAAARAGQSGSNEAPYRVMIVEDDPSQALFAESILNGAGMQAQVVPDPGLAIATLEVFQPDLVLMDLHMPSIDGTELTHMIRSHGAFAQTPIVFLTGDPDPERQFEVMEVGADDFLTKPVRPAELLVRVQGGLRLRQMSRELREQYDLVRQQRDALMRLQLQRERLSSFLVHDLKNPVDALDAGAQRALRA